jgi:hypothetical protein
MDHYPLSSELRKAIERLFKDPGAALAALAADRSPRDDRNASACDPTLPAIERAALVRAKLENYVQHMALEHEEMGSPEASDTLRMQAIGLLIALRELVWHFPEVAGQ